MKLTRHRLWLNIVLILITASVLNGCATSQPPKITQTCPVLPELPARFQPVSVSTMQELDELLENFEQKYLQ